MLVSERHHFRSGLGMFSRVGFIEQPGSVALEVAAHRGRGEGEDAPMRGLEGGVQGSVVGTRVELIWTPGGGWDPGQGGGAHLEVGVLWGWWRVGQWSLATLGPLLRELQSDLRKQTGT